MHTNTHSIQHIGLLRLSALGDVTLMVAVVRAIQEAHPSWKITWIIGRGAYQLLAGLSGVDFVVIDKPQSVRDYWKLRKQLKHYRFDVLLAAQASLRTNLIYPLIKAKTKIGFDAQRARDGHRFFVNRTIAPRQEHLLDGFMQFAAMLDAEMAEPLWDLPIDQDDWSWAKAQLNQTGPWLAINPASSKLERDWFVERYVEVIEYVAQRWGVRVLLTGGPAQHEIKMAEAICDQASVECLNLVGQTPMKRLAALLGSVDVLLAPDTGPVHIATAMGTPVVGLYAVATAKLTGPYLSQDLVVDRYPEALRAFLHKDPDLTPWRTRVHDTRAMELITVEAVLAQLEKLFGDD